MDPYKIIFDYKAIKLPAQKILYFFVPVPAIHCCAPKVAC